MITHVNRTMRLACLGGGVLLPATALVGGAVLSPVGLSALAGSGLALGWLLQTRWVSGTLWVTLGVAVGISVLSAFGLSRLPDRFEVWGPYSFHPFLFGRDFAELSIRFLPWTILGLVFLAGKRPGIAITAIGLLLAVQFTTIRLLEHRFVSDRQPCGRTSLPLGERTWLRETVIIQDGGKVHLCLEDNPRFDAPWLIYRIMDVYPKNRKSFEAWVFLGRCMNCDHLEAVTTADKAMWALVRKESPPRAVALIEDRTTGKVWSVGSSDNPEVFKRFQELYTSEQIKQAPTP